MRQFKINKRVTDRTTHCVEIYLRELGRYPVLSPQEEESLFYKMREGDKSARDYLIKCNLRFVISVAKQYHFKNVALEDVISAGNAGLVVAIDKFDPTRGFKFISYAVWWIRQSIQSFIISQSSTIRVPANSETATKEIKDKVTELENQLGTEISEFSAVPFTNNPKKSIRYISNFVRSGDEPMGEDSSTCVFDSFRSEDAESLLDQNDRHLMVTKVMKAVLTDREYNVVKRFFGIGCVPESLAEIGKSLNITRERTRQLWSNSMTKLKSDKCKNLLTSYISA